MPPSPRLAVDAAQPPPAARAMRRARRRVQAARRRARGGRELQALQALPCVLRSVLVLVLVLRAEGESAEGKGASECSVRPNGVQLCQLHDRGRLDEHGMWQPELCDKVANFLGPQGYYSKRELHMNVSDDLMNLGPPASAEAVEALRGKSVWVFGG